MVDFDRFKKAPFKVSVLTSLVVWPSHCIRKKPGERCLTSETHADAGPGVQPVSVCRVVVPGVVVVRVHVVHRGMGPGTGLIGFLRHFREFRHF